MQVILLEPGKLGKTGDVVNVKDGYARNWLIPQGIATPATASNTSAPTALRTHSPTPIERVIARNSRPPIASAIASEVAAPSA